MSDSPSGVVSEFWYLHGDVPNYENLPEVVAIDTETTGLRWTDSLLGVALAWRDGDKIRSCYFNTIDSLFYEDIWTDERVLNFLIPLLIEKTLVGHYISFDARVLFKAFGMIPMNCFDTWHMAKSTRFMESYSLQSLTTLFSLFDPDWAAQKKFRGRLLTQNPQSVAEYAQKDAIYALMAFEHLLKDYEATGKIEKDQDFSRLTYEMMARGFPLNEGKLLERLEKETAQFNELQFRLAKHGISNVKSPSKVVEVLRERGIHVLNASAEALAPFASDPLVADIIAANQLESDISSRLSIFQKYNHKGRLHSEWHPFGTASYRMVAKDPNLMAQPLKDRKGRVYENLSELFVDEDNYCLQLDIAQAEVRLAAMISRCNPLAGLLSGGQDVYLQMAKLVYGKANEENRQKAKRATLASIYEEGPVAFSAKHGVPITEATEILNQFRTAFPEIKQMSRSYMEFAKANGFINLYTGRRIYFDKNDERLYRAFNQEIQGGLAELMRDFMLKVDKAFPGTIIGQIHDSLILNFKRKDIRREDIDEICNTCSKLLQESLPDKVQSLTDPKIPMKLDFSPFKPIFDEGF